jgi:peptidoglycan/LPS O-acetylase OafA/YrhL
VLSQLSRITTPGREYIAPIDGLRFLAVMAVIPFHVWAIGTYHLGCPGDTSNIVAKTFNAGSMGVQLFFAISGFILALPFARQFVLRAKPVSIREYFIRRVTRIEPPYIIQLIFVFLLVVLVLHRLPDHQVRYGSQDWFSFTAAHMLASLFYAHILIFKTYPYPNIVLWSLEIEVQFYIVAPLLARVFLIRGKWVRRALLLTVLLGWPKLLGWMTQEAPYRFGFFGELQFFLIGFLLVDFYLDGWMAPKKKNFIWDGLFFLCLPAVVYWPALEIWIILLLCIAGFRGPIASWLMSNPWITTIGGMCYTIYMYHWLLISTLIRGTIHLKTGILWMDLLVQFVVMAPLIVLISAFLFVWFERPFMRRDWPARFRQAVLQAKQPLLPEHKEPQGK